MNVPKLRFKDDDGREFPEWREKQLGNIASFSKGKGISKADIDVNGATYCIRYGELYTDYRETIKTVKSKTNIAVENLVLSEVNDVIIPASGETQIDIATASCVQVAGVALGGDLNIIKSQENGVFLSYYLNSQKKLDIAKLAQGNSVVHLYSSQLRLLDLNLPSKSEQTKIANFLTAVDEKITQLTKKSDLLAQYKKGVMQKIFSQELRFKDDDGREFPEWDELTLNDVIVSISNGLSIDQNNEKNGFKVTRIETISERSINLDKVGYVVTDIDISDSKLNVGDILFSNINSLSHIGKVVYVDKYYDLYHGMNLLRVVVDQISHNPKFIFFQLSTDKLKRNFEAKANKAVNQASINQTELKKTELQVPSKKEQTKIANFLTAIDDKITQTQAELDAVKQYKQGLLQQMFV